MIQKGDTIGIVALAGDCEKEKIETAKFNLEKLGYKVKLAENIFDKENYLAGNDNKKVEQLHNFFKDDKIKLILNARGGYGSIRLINKIDYDLIKQNPKPFCGYSDITALLLMIYNKTGMITYHGPMFCSDFYKLDDYTIKNFGETINNSQTQIYNLNGNDYTKSVEGILWGGNLSTLVSLCGQNFIPQKDFIFFTEDLNEPVYKIDKMFTQLFNIEQFRQYCKGIIVGDFMGLDNQNWFEDLLNELTINYEIPICRDLKITHNTSKKTIPIGEQCIIKF